ncbi:MAG TPA: NAD(P)H-hydrate dehydratase [Candidatus Hydrothermia bacterium]|nr:NAD(P)H-hydrate dehydratase [Candidatus Hydrothermia bacterium]HOK23789.1 NAD(P)H-hydrate dehydratase [Candidatus Hydrothermia bacterium]HOL24576.1 NAD(P)H-hydrate dehydratase [Candidatus Hydrothermia bacterium]HPO79591.1 NAD(P)H-hydrate dehydratase [Candidatus Hydrothermia bacterium]HRD22371.1 NAD(P)H-hydrate dehydratase [Candidatus Hydrothermia bacterium]
MSFKVLTPEQMKQADLKAQEELHISPLILMENAGKSVANEIIKRFGSRLNRMSVGIFCGKGNNGGDGLVAARYLKRKAKSVTVFIFTKEEEFSRDAAIQLKAAKRENIEIRSAQDFLKKDESFGIYIDAIFGTGFKGKMESPYLEIVEGLNNKNGFKVACDIPSGVNGETGTVENVAFRAHLTSCFAFPKTGILLFPGRYFAGEVKVFDIGIPENIVESDKIMMEGDDLTKYLPNYIGNEHKGICGKVLIVAGSKAYTGAAFFTAASAVESGAGLTYLAAPKEIAFVMQSKLNEVIILPYKNIEDLRAILHGDFDVIGCGPGLGRDENTIKTVKEILNLPHPKVIDADGLWALSNIESPSLTGCILTPHPGEATFLIPNKSAKEIDADRISVSKEIPKKYNCITVLKGAPTVTSDGNVVYFNPTGNPGMAVGGMGDVLTGILSGLLPRIKDPLGCALLATYVHGLSADLLLESETFETITPTKVLCNLNQAFGSLRKCG